MPRSKERVTADALIEIASDPNRYKQLMDEYQLRQRDAVTAEGKARDAQREAEAAEGRTQGTEQALSERSASVSTREIKLRSGVLDLEDQAARVKKAENAVTGRETAVHQREDALAGLHSAAMDAVVGLIRGVK